MVSTFGFTLLPSIFRPKVLVSWSNPNAKARLPEGSRSLYACWPHHVQKATHDLMDGVWKISVTYLCKSWSITDWLDLPVVDYIIRLSLRDLDFVVCGRDWVVILMWAGNFVTYFTPEMLIINVIAITAVKSMLCCICVHIHGEFDSSVTPLWIQGFWGLNEPKFRAIMMIVVVYRFDRMHCI